MAIEFFQTGQEQYVHTTKTDVWAFGMTVYVSSVTYATPISLSIHVCMTSQELLTLERPYAARPPARPPARLTHHDKAHLLHIMATITNGEKPTIPENS